jgi:DNA-binding NarL/FixJ family response regulator
MLQNTGDSSISELTKLEPIRIFIVEDSDVVRSALRAILGQDASFQLVGEAVDGNTAVSRLLAVKPDVVLIDIGLPGKTGIEVTREFKQKAPHIKALMFTSNIDDRLMIDSFSAGADGYMVKEGFQKETLETAIRSVMRNKCWLAPDIAKRILSFAKLYNKALPASLSGIKVEPLTQQEEQVLDTAGCTDGVCPVDPAFLVGLQRLTKLQQ